MAQIIKEIDVEVIRPNLFQAVVAKQNDCNSRFIKAAFVNKGEKIDITPVSKVLINARRSDGESGSFEGVVNDDSTVTVPLHSWILEVDGMVDCDISTINELDEKLTSTKFQVFVEKAACSTGDIVDDPQYDVLTDLIEQVESLSPAEMDTELSETSENPVQNKVVTEAIKGKADQTDLDDLRATHYSSVAFLQNELYTKPSQEQVDAQILEATQYKTDWIWGAEGQYGGFEIDGTTMSAISADTTPIKDSKKLITSGGVYTVMGDIETALDNIIAMQEGLIGGDAE